MTREGALLGLLRPLGGAVVYEAGAQIITSEQGSFRHCHVLPHVDPQGGLLSMTYIVVE